MSDNIDIGLFEFVNHQCHRIKYPVKIGRDIAGVCCEGDVTRHVQDNVVAIAGNADTGTLQLHTQLVFLFIHI